MQLTNLWTLIQLRQFFYGIVSKYVGVGVCVCLCVSVCMTHYIFCYTKRLKN